MTCWHVSSFNVGKSFRLHKDLESLNHGKLKVIEFFWFSWNIIKRIRRVVSRKFILKARFGSKEFTYKVTYDRVISNYHIVLLSQGVSLSNSLGPSLNRQSEVKTSLRVSETQIYTITLFSSFFPHVVSRSDVRSQESGSYWVTDKENLVSVWISKCIIETETPVWTHQRWSWHTGSFGFYKWK